MDRQLLCHDPLSPFPPDRGTPGPGRVAPDMQVAVAQTTRPNYAQSRFCSLAPSTPGGGRRPRWPPGWAPAPKPRRPSGARPAKRAGPCSRPRFARPAPTSRKQLAGRVEAHRTALSRRALNRPFAGKAAVQAAVDRGKNRQTAEPTPRNRQFTPAGARIELAKLYPAIQCFSTTTPAFARWVHARHPPGGLVPGSAHNAGWEY